MDLPRPDAQAGARFRLEAFGIGKPLVEQHIVSGKHDEGRRNIL